MTRREEANFSYQKLTLILPTLLEHDSGDLLENDTFETHGSQILNLST